MKRERKDLAPLGGMDGSIDLYDYDADGNYIWLFVSSKPSPYQSVPTKIVEEDTITLVLRKNDSGRRFLRAEIRGYEKGSRFLVVFRLGSVNGPIRIENRTKSITINLRQSGLSDDAWLQLQPLSTTNFAWEDPYGQELPDVSIHSGGNISFQNFSLENIGEGFTDEWAKGIQLHVLKMFGKKIALLFIENPFAAH